MRHALSVTQTMKKILSLCLFLSFISFAHAEIYWIDVRTPAEFAERHKEGAINIPLHQLENTIGQTARKDDEIHLYCRSGTRAQRALEILRAQGYTHIINEGGLNSILSQENISGAM